MRSSPTWGSAARTPLLALLLAAGCASTAPGVSPSERPSRIDFERHGLQEPPADQRERIAGALADLPCPCGDGHTATACLAAHPERNAQRQLRAAALLARMGATRTEIVGELQRDRAAFFSPRVSLTLTPGACRGPADAPVTVVVFSDFECHWCSVFSSLAEPMLEQAKGKARLCFKHFPLSGHRNAALAAQAAEYAASHGKFWELHDRFFQHPESLGASDLAKHGREVGLDGEGLAHALASKAYVLQVEESVAEGRKVGVDHTPFVFVNGRPLTLPLDGETLWLAVDEEIDRIAALEAAAGR